MTESREEAPAASDPRRTVRRGHLAVAAIALLGLTLTLVCTALFHAAAAQADAARRAETVFAVRSLLQADLLRLFNQVGGFSAWIEETGFDDPMAFEAYHDRATRFMDNVPWRAVAVAAVLPRERLTASLAALDERRILYAAARYPRFELVPATDLDEVMPVLMVEPRENRTRVFGFDMASEARRRAAVRSALESGRPTLTPLLTLTQDASDDADERPPSALLVAPLRRAREDAGDDLGVVAFSFTPDRLVARAIARASGQALSYRLSVEAATQDPAASGPAGEAPESIRVEEVGPQLLRARFFDQHWNIELTFTGEDTGSGDTGTLLVFVLGLLATGLALALTRRVTHERLRLQAVIADRTAELERTRDAIADAHRIDALGRLTGGVAHDFNNLLGVIAGNLDLLRDALPADLADDTHGLVDDATQATERGARLTQKLLTLSRQASLRPEVLDLDDVVREMTTVLRRTLPATIEVSHRLAGDLPPVRIDRVQLESALLNLAINARDAMPGGGRLTLATRRIDDADATGAELCVTDTGTGMNPDVARRALDPFFTTKAVGQGTGLGLAIVAGFVGQSGGEVKVDSVEGRGTSVRLRFPATDASAGETADDGQEWTPVARAGERIVVIEDNAELRLVLDRQLRALGYDVLCAEDGRAGLDAVERAAHVDLVLSDCVLPGDVDGYAVARELAQRRPELPVVLMSGYADPPAPGPDASGPPPIRLTKPIRRAELARELRARIDARTGDR